MKEGKDSLSVFLREHISPSGKSEIMRFKGTQPPSGDLIETLRKEINVLMIWTDFSQHCLPLSSLFGDTRKLLVHRSKHAELWENSPERQDARILLNRMSLTDSYPGAFAR